MARSVGSFSWQNAKINYEGLLPSWFEIIKDNCSDHTIEPQEGCSVQIKPKPDIQGGTTALVGPVGDNIDNGYCAANIVVKGDWTIALNEDVDDYHLGYRSVEILNASNDLVNIKSIDIQIDDDLKSKVKYCGSKNDNDCYYPKNSVVTNCVPNDTQLSQYDRCLIWFKTLDDGMDLNKTSGNIVIKVGATNSTSSSTKSKTFPVTYRKALYVGGKFDKAGGKTAKRIAMWDGDEWFALGNLNGEEIRALAVMANGDLYVGGDSLYLGISVVSYITRWNGSNWLTLGSGVNGPVNALAYSNINDTLYVGGLFDNAWKVLKTSNIAGWSGFEFSILGDGTNGEVYAINVVGNDLYVGGKFTSADNKPGTNYIAKWNDTLGWSELAGGTNGPVYTITNMGNYIYVGGSFSNAGQAWRIYNIAYWDGINWNTLGPCVPYGAGTDGDVYALTNMNNFIYLGGKFNSAGNEPYTKHIASYGDYFPHICWSWKALDGGQGIDGNVYALASVGDNLYIGGQFTSVIGVGPMSCVAIWSKTSGWLRLPPDFGVLLSSDPNAAVVKALIVATSITFD